MLILLLLRPVKIHNSTSTVLFDRHQELLAAAVSADGMWQFPQCDSVPYRFRTCLVQFEDEYFDHHFGVNPLSVFRALWQNIRAGHVVSGASTITMQLVRLSRRGKPRRYSEKLLEMLLAVRTEMAYTKNQILTMYASNAPFGGNVVGVDAAAWRYFGTATANLSWAEAAALAVLPNAPGLVFPGRNRQTLLNKRNQLLLKLKQNGIIDNETYQLSLLEPTPNPANRLPQEASHLLIRCMKGDYDGKIVESTLDRNIQRDAQQIAIQHHKRFCTNGIHNLGLMIIDNSNGEVLAYVGNVESEGAQNSSRVDVITAQRSYGSLLKPFLYGVMVSEGLLMPRQLVNDIPTAFSGFTPENFSRTFDGVVPANEVIARSLNVPSVNLLQQYGVEKFYNKLKNMGFTSINRSPDHYGLSLILGGAEATMEELAGAYSALSRRAQGLGDGRIGLRYFSDSTLAPTRVFRCPDIGTGAAYLTLQALTQATRPDERGALHHFVQKQPIAWKTGTSWGFRDAWAVGVTQKFTVAVWVGNADGEGRAQLIGVATAAPLMFDIFATLPISTWYQKPIFDLQAVETCKQSGLLPSADCSETLTEDVPLGNIQTLPCTYHHRIFIDRTSGKRVTRGCAKPSEIEAQSWFVLPPVQEWYYSRIHHDYKHLPPFREGCNEPNDNLANLALIYPYANVDIYLPREVEQTRGQSVWRATHRNPQAKIYWHLNDTFLGTTVGKHELLVSPKPGQYTLTLVDDQGESISRKIRILGANKGQSTSKCSMAR